MGTVLKFTPRDCPHCEYDRRFPDTAMGGWVYPGNNSQIVPCPMCNPQGAHERVDPECAAALSGVRATMAEG